MDAIVTDSHIHRFDWHSGLENRLVLRAAVQVERTFGGRLLLPGLVRCRACSRLLLPWLWLNQGPIYTCRNHGCVGGRVPALDTDATVWSLLQANPSAWAALEPLRRAKDVLGVLRSHIDSVLVDLRPSEVNEIELLWTPPGPGSDAVGGGPGERFMVSS